MPCLILTGHPCVGKTTFAHVLRERALQHSKSQNVIQNVLIINEESACPDWTKTQCYANSQAEKKTRGALKAEFDRAVSGAGPETLVVLDSMNYIKGFRYELHCISKASGQRHGVIWILNSVEMAKQWNKCVNKNEEEEEGHFKEELLEELMLRYEPPDARNRWDKPLYRMDLTPQKCSGEGGSKTTTSVAAENALKRSVYNMHALSDSINDDSVAGTASTTAKKSSFKRAGFKRAAKPQERNDQAPMEKDAAAQISIIAQHDTSTPLDETKKTLSLEQRIDEILDSFLLDVEPLKEGLSTKQHLTAGANVLHEVDTTTQQVCNAISSSQKMSSVMGNNSIVTIPLSSNNDETITLNLGRTVSLAELKRLRRQYIRWVGTHPPEDSSQRGIAISFVAYMEAQL